MALQDFVVASRVLRKSPGIHSDCCVDHRFRSRRNTAIFSVINAVLLQPLPYTDSDRLVIGGMDLRVRNVHDLPFSNADFIDLRDGTKAFFQDFAGVFTGRNVVPREDGTSEQIRWAVATTNFFRVTGARILLGRDFSQQDGIPGPPGRPHLLGLHHRPV